MTATTPPPAVCATRIELLDEDARAEVLDLFADSYGVFNTLRPQNLSRRRAIRSRLWGGIYSLMESPFVEKQLGGFARLQNTLEKILAETQPDCVVSTYPVYAHVIKKIYRNHHERPFRFITVVTDSISVNSAWYRAPSDLFLRGERSHRGSAAERRRIRKANPDARFPGQPSFAEPPAELPAAGRARTAPAALPDQHRQEKGRQSHRPPARNLDTSLDHHRGPRCRVCAPNLSNAPASTPTA